MPSQARYGASATCAADRVATAVAASQTPSIGTQHSAARYSPPGGQPASPAAAGLPPATRETGAAAVISAAAARSRVIRNAARAAARTADLAAGRLITAAPPAGPVAALALAKVPRAG